MMPGLFASIGPLFAQEAGNPGNLSGLLILLPLPFLFYFLIWLPQKQQEKKRQAMIEGLKKNDRVMTAAGMYGTIVSIDPAQDRLVLRVDDEKGVKISMTRSSVARVMNSSSD